MTCQKAQGFLDANHVQVAQTVDASKDRRNATQALDLCKTVDRVIVARGKKVVSFDMKKDPPDDETLLAHLLGPTGNLRAPSIRKGKTLLVGFNDEAYSATFKQPSAK
jgi:arsenate reductase-like glutaredoxin family protein